MGTRTTGVTTIALLVLHTGERKTPFSIKYQVNYADSSIFEIATLHQST